MKYKDIALLIIGCCIVIVACFLLTSCTGTQSSSPSSVEQFSHEVEDITSSASAEPEQAVEPESEPEQAQEAPDPEPVEEYEYEFYQDDNWVEEYEYVEYTGYTGGSTATDLGDLLNGQGRAIDEDGTNYTWYYHDLGYGALDIPDETFDENGVSHDGDGYIVVATDAYEKGTVIDTPYGEAKVYDSGCGSTIDIYTNR